MRLVPSPSDVNIFHQYSDADRTSESQHHTLGIRRYQAASGAHTHDGSTSLQLPNYFPLSKVKWGNTGLIVTDANGIVTFNHDLGVVPSAFLAVFGPGGIGTNLRITSLTATTVTIHCFQASGTDVVSSNVRLQWIALA